MTSGRVKSIRGYLNVSQEGLAQALRLGPNGKRTVGRWETGETAVPGPVSVALEAMESGWLPGIRKERLQEVILADLGLIKTAVLQAEEHVRNIQEVAKVPPP